MPQAIYFAVILVGLYTIATGTSAESYYVTPTPSEPCPEEGVPCFNLTEYATEDSGYFADNTTLIFLPGNHALDSELLIMNITMLTIFPHGSQLNTVVNCNQSARFIFENIGSSVTMKGLEFVGCANNTVTSVDEFMLEDCVYNYNGQVPDDGLNFFKVANISVMNTTFMHIIGGSAISFKECGTVVLSDSTFKDNIENRDITVGALIGAAVGAGDSEMIEINHCSFINNSAIAYEFAYGAAVYLNLSNSVMNDCVFINNSVRGSTVYAGGAVFALGASDVTMNSCNFSDNSATGDGYGYGGAVYVWGQYASPRLIINDCNFIDNIVDGKHLAEGGAVYATNVYTITISSTKFVSNSVTGDTGNGGALTFQNGFECTIINSEFVRNIVATYELEDGAGYGGAVALFSTNIKIDNSIFTDNEATTENFTTTTATITTRDCNTLEGGGAVTGFLSDITFSGNTSFMHNRAMCGGAISVRESNIFVYGNVTIIYNKATLSGGGIFAYLSELILNAENVSISNNRAEKNGGGIHAVSSSIRVSNGSQIFFTSNNASRGGGLCLVLNAKVYLLKGEPEFINDTMQGSQPPWIIVEFSENSAEIFGGAIYIADDTNSGTCGTSLNVDESQAVFSECLIQTLGLYKLKSGFRGTPEQAVAENINTMNIFFNNNSATSAGETLYGGLLDRCVPSLLAEYFIKYTNSTPDSLDGTSYIQNITNLPDTTEQLRDVVASEAVRLCFCKDNKPDCNYHPDIPPVPKGKQFDLPPLVAVDQVNNSVSDAINVHAFVHLPAQIGEGQSVKMINGTCETLSYNITSPNDIELLYLYADGPCMEKGVSTKSLKINFECCPIGFNKSDNNEKCVCHEDLNDYIEGCSIQDTTVSRNRTVWISYSEVESGFLLYSHCPYDYCLLESIPINLNILDGADAQCDSNRSKILCGSCKEGLSLILGSSRCKPCSNYWLFLLIPFALAGIALVTFVLVFNLTVAVGTINGLIFYANIIAAVRPIVILPLHKPNFFTVFIAWLNLDLGIETCFYNGMNGYAKTWLQLVFPTYILFLVVMVIIICHYSQRFANLLSNRNPVATLATLILLSYAKFLRTIIASLSPANIEHTNGPNETVWLVDGNIPYLKGEHTPLFITALIILLVGLVFSFILFFWQWLLRFPYWRGFRWIRNTKLNFFMATYCAPYTPQHRYWTGLLLFARGLLYLVFAVLEDPEICLFSTICVTGTLMLMMCLFKSKIYKEWPLFAIETSFIFNLILMSAATLFTHIESSVKESDTGTETAFAYTSVGIAFSTFLIILAYHTYAYVIKCPLKMITERFRNGVWMRMNQEDSNERQTLVDSDFIEYESEVKYRDTALDLVDSRDDHVYGSTHTYSREKPKQPRKQKVTYSVVDAP